MNAMNSKLKVYGLRPDRRFIEACDDYELAKDSARTLVASGHYIHAEVWSAEKPVFAVWAEDIADKRTKHGAGRVIHEGARRGWSGG